MTDSLERIEIIPADGIIARVAASLPAGSALSVTALPKHDIETTIDVAVELAASGYDAVPHLAATRIADREHLARILTRLDDSAVTGLFVVGGDGDRASTRFCDGGELLEAIRDRSAGRFRIGVAGYPEGHPALSVEAGLEVLRAKAEFADYAVTQMCFDAERLVEYLHAAARAGVTMPLQFGVPGPVRLRALLGIAARIGVGASLSFVSKRSNLRLLGRFDAQRFRAELLTRVAEAHAEFAGFHVYSFNEFAPARA